MPSRPCRPQSWASTSFGAEAGTFKASLVAGAETFGFGVSAGFDACTAFGTSAGGEASASFVASTGWEQTDLDGSPCGADAANRSLNISEDRDVLRRGHHQRALLQRREYFVESRPHRTGSNGGRVS